MQFSFILYQAATPTADIKSHRQNRQNIHQNTQKRKQYIKARETVCDMTSNKHWRERNANTRKNIRACDKNDTCSVASLSAWRHVASLSAWRHMTSQMTSQTAAAADDDDDGCRGRRLRGWSTEDTVWEDHSVSPPPLTAVTAQWPWDPRTPDSRSFYLPITAPTNTFIKLCPTSYHPQTERC